MRLGLGARRRHHRRHRAALVSRSRRRGFRGGDRADRRGLPRPRRISLRARFPAPRRCWPNSPRWTSPWASPPTTRPRRPPPRSPPSASTTTCRTSSATIRSRTRSRRRTSCSPSPPPTGIDPSDIAVVGDNRYDLEMARAAGAGPRSACSPATAAPTILRRYADVVLPSIRDLPAWLATRSVRVSLEPSNVVTTPRTLRPEIRVEDLLDRERTRLGNDAIGSPVSSRSREPRVRHTHRPEPRLDSLRGSDCPGRAARCGLRCSRIVPAHPGFRFVGWKRHFRR